MSHSGPLNDLRVLDATQLIAGPQCTKLLAAYGADVIKLERPGVGDNARRLGPFPGDVPDVEASGLFLHLNLAKRGMTLDLRCSTGAAIFRALARNVDLVIESFRPGMMQGFGLDYQSLRRDNPTLVMVSISNFGQSGPYVNFKSSEMITYATGGPMLATGVPEREPLKLAGRSIQMQAGIAAALAALTSYFGAAMTGMGDHVDMSLYETQAASQDRRTTQLIGYQYTGQIFTRRPQGSLIGEGTRATQDGYAMLGGSTKFEAVCEMIGRLDALEDSRFSTYEARNQPTRADEFDIEYLFPWILEKTSQDVWSEGQDHGLATAPIYTSKEVLEDPGFRSRTGWQRIDHPVARSFTYPPPPFRMSKSPPRIDRSAPTLGQHNREILIGELGLSTCDVVDLFREGVI